MLIATVMAFDIASVFGAALNFVLFGDPSKVHSYVSPNSTWFWAHAIQYGQNCLAVTYLIISELMCHLET